MKNILYFLCKPRKFKSLFIFFFVIYLCLSFCLFLSLFLTDFKSATYLDSETMFTIQFVGAVLILCVLGGIIGAGMWMLVTWYHRRTPYYLNYLKTKDKTNDQKT